MEIMFFLRQFIVSLIIITTSIMAEASPTTTSFEGLFQLVKVQNDNQDIPVPTNSCTLRIQQQKQQQEQSNASTESNQYDIYLKIGNSMGGSAIIIPSLSVTDSFVDDDVKTNTNGDELTSKSVPSAAIIIEGTISIGGIRSTMMMPPPELYAIERAISDILPSAANIRLIETDVVLLIIKGSKGYIQAKRIVE